MFRNLILAASAAVLAMGGSAQATEFVQNGGFELSSLTHNYQFGAGFGGQTVNNWTGAGGNQLQFYYRGGTQTFENATNQFNDPLGYFHPSFSTLSSQGGNFVGLDGDSQYRGQISQLITGLTVGQTYKLTFDWAAAQLINRTGATTEQLQVMFGADTFNTAVVPNISGGFSGWMSESHSFTATSTSQLLTFLSVGTPNGLPPIAALDAVSLTGGVPEPATWALMLMGFGAVGFAARRVRRAAA